MEEEIIVQKKEDNQKTDNMPNFFEQIEDHGPKLIELWKDVVEIESKGSKEEFDRIMKRIEISQKIKLKYTHYAVWIIGIMLVGTMILVGIDKLDGAALTFLLGTILGYFISLIVRFSPVDFDVTDYEE